VRELFDEEGPSSHRSMGYQLAQKFSNFWHHDGVRSTCGDATRRHARRTPVEPDRRGS
jgi:hypothetical protein